MLFKRATPSCRFRESFTLADALEKSFLEAERPACAGWIEQSLARCFLAAKPHLFLTSPDGAVDPPCKPEACTTFFTDRPEDQGEARWRVVTDYLRRRRQTASARRGDCYHPVSNSLQESTFIVANASPAMRTRSGCPTRCDLLSGDQRY
jgi:hypothetical protein